LGRLIVFLWLIHRWTYHAVTNTVVRLEWLLYPEALIARYTAVGNITPRELSAVAFGLLLVLGSFVLATPVLGLVCFKRNVE
jgi:hypothetical protein